MINGIISAIVQIVIFTIIPFIVYLVAKKSRKGFFEYIGLKHSNSKANLLALCIGLIIALPPLLLTIFSVEFYEIMTNPESVTGKFKAMGFSLVTIVLILIKAILQTALAEEILFRGFIAKRIIAFTSYRTGNILQALLFGVIHTLIFMTMTENPFFLAFIFAFPSIGAYLNVYINEKLADGSIVPGWISHGTANVISYSVVGFVI